MPSFYYDRYFPEGHLRNNDIIWSLLPARVLAQKSHWKKNMFKFSSLDVQIFFDIKLNIESYSE